MLLVVPPVLLLIGSREMCDVHHCQFFASVIRPPSTLLALYGVCNWSVGHKQLPVLGLGVSNLEGCSLLPQ